MSGTYAWMVIKMVSTVIRA